MTTADDRPRDLSKLLHVPVFALKRRLSALLGPTVPVNSLNRSQLIELVTNTPAITSDVVDQLFEDYRYGARPRFSLYLLPGADPRARVTDTSAWNAALAQLQPDPQTLCVAAQDTDSLCHGIVEVRFTHRTTHRYIDPDAETDAAVRELNYGFAWVNIEHGYALTSIRNDRACRLILAATQCIVGAAPLPASIPRRLSDKYFPPELICRASYDAGPSGIRRTIAADDPKLLRSEALAQEHASIRKASVHKDYITDNLRSRIGVHQAHGTVYVTKTLGATELRKWMYSTLHPLLLDMQSASPRERFQVAWAPPSELHNLRRTAQQFFREIANGILTKQSDQGALVTMSAPADRVHASLREYFLQPRPYFFCRVCEETSPVCCPNCDYDPLRACAGHLTCPECRTRLSGPSVAVRCANGHEAILDYPERHLTLYPDQSLQQAMARLINGQEGLHFNPDEEVFWIDGNQLNYTRSRTPVVVPPEAIEAFAALPAWQSIPQAVRDRACAEVAQMPEKCQVHCPEHTGQPRKEDCEQCFATNPDRLCLPKLFRAIDRHFAPTPHGGHELGDAGITVTLQGTPRTLACLCKQSPPDKTLTRADTSAKQLLEQIIYQVIRDQAVEAFGVALAGPLESSLKAAITTLARVAGKPVVFFGLEELARMYCALLMDPAHAALADHIPAVTN